MFLAVGASSFTTASRNSRRPWFLHDFWGCLLISFRNHCQLLCDYRFIHIHSPDSLLIKLGTSQLIYLGEYSGFVFIVTWIFVPMYLWIFVSSVTQSHQEAFVHARCEPTQIIWRDRHTKTQNYLSEKREGPSI